MTEQANYKIEEEYLFYPIGNNVLVPAPYTERHIIRIQTLTGHTVAQ